MNGKNTRLLSRGFTIVELLVAIIVIGVLAAITMVSYAGISQRAAVATLQSDLSNYSRKLEIYRVEHSDNYPDDPVTAGIPAGSYSSYIKDNNTNPKTFTIKAQKVSAGTTIIYKVSNGSVPAPYTPGGTVSVLVVGGGGGGDGGNGWWSYSGSGGAGGIVNYNASYSVTSSIAVTVGGGGSGVYIDSCGVAGGSSSFGTITSAGGNGSWGCWGPFGGDNGIYSGGDLSGLQGGGGGAGSTGNGSSINGGPGYYSSIRGTGSIGYGGGGGGSIYDGNFLAGSASAGGGIFIDYGVEASSGGTNTGGGGGGSWYANGGNGGSGIVIVSYPTGSMSATGGTITTSSGNTIHTFTSNGTFAPI